jgi:hypothetical protein
MFRCARHSVKCSYPRGCGFAQPMITDRSPGEAEGSKIGCGYVYNLTPLKSNLAKAHRYPI